MTKPIIGITLDSEENGSFSSYPYYALRKHYSNAIEALGGVPIFLAQANNCLDVYLTLIDGLLIPGGNVDIPPELYGDTMLHPETILNHTRSSFDMQILRAAFAANMPILGICAGEQALNVCFGGSLWQHIPDQIPQAKAHKHQDARNKLVHEVKLIPGTLLAHILQDEHSFMVNSHHHQAVRVLGQDLVACAIAEDGVIEAIAHHTHPFCLGIEWHPEYMDTPQDKLIMQAFVAAASITAARSTR